MSKTSSSGKGMLLLANKNRILEETVRDQIMRDPNEKRQQLLDVKLCDFDEVSYNVKINNTELGDGEPSNPMTVSISIPCFSQIKDEGTIDEAKRVFGEWYSDCVPDGYDLGLSIDFQKLADEEKKKEQLIKNIGKLKYIVTSGPFVKYFSLLKKGESGDNYDFDIRSDTKIYFRPGEDRVTIIYAVDFNEKVDKVLAKIFMQELVDARKRIRTAPPFMWSADPPLEIRDKVSSNPGILGYASIPVMSAHVSGDKMHRVIGALINFRSFLQYHIKCAKSFFHSRMRAKCSELLKILNRAKVKFGKTEKKTKSGRTFKRN